MSADNFWLLDESGLPDSYIDASELQENARRIIDRLLEVALDPEKVVAELCSEIMASPGSEMARLVLAVSVIDNVVSGVLAPLIVGNSTVRDSIAEHLIQRRAMTPPAHGEKPESEAEHV
jgi:hypothetical protein